MPMDLCEASAGTIDLSGTGVSPLEQAAPATLAHESLDLHQHGERGRRPKRLMICADVDVAAPARYRGRMKNTVLRCIARACVIGLAIASWTPGEAMIRTGFNTRLERTVAYLVAGAFVILAYPQKPIWFIAMILCTYAGILEFGQIYIRGRHAAVFDWIASSAGVLCASLTAAVFDRWATG